MTNRELNLKFYDALNDIFSINKKRTWDELSKEITIPKISETYKIFGQIFPYNLDRYSLLPKNDPKEKLTAIFHGELDGHTIINNVSRYSLYCDEIIVFHPLKNPSNTPPKYDPISRPEKYRFDFVQALYFYIVLQKWVRAGIVHLIENPIYFDYGDFEHFCEMAKNRIAGKEAQFMTVEVSRELDEKHKQDTITSLLGMPDYVIENHVRQAYPNSTNSEIKLLTFAVKEYGKSLPLYVDFGNNIETGNFTFKSNGGNIEMIDAICKLTGAHSYTTQKIISRQLELRGENPFWTKFGILYSGLNLTYLDGVDTSFALAIREEEKISGLRKSLRELGNFLDKTELENLPDDKVLHFNDSMKDAIRKSETEWQKIYDDARKFNITSLTGASTISAFIDPTKIIVPALALPTSIAISEFFKYKNLKSYRAKDPYSVFVDLKNKKPSFYSELKNCIF